MYTFDNGDNRIEEYRLAWKTEYKTGIFRTRLGWAGLPTPFHTIFLLPVLLTNTRSIRSITAPVSTWLTPFAAARSAHQAAEIPLGIRTNVDLKTGKTYWQPRGGVEFNPFNGLKFHYSAEFSISFFRASNASTMKGITTWCGTCPVKTEREP